MAKFLGIYRKILSTTENKRQLMREKQKTDTGEENITQRSLENENMETEQIRKLKYTVPLCV